MTTTYPRKVPGVPVGNLREVAPDLYVCGVFALAWPGPYDTVIDLIGTSLGPSPWDEQDFSDGYVYYRKVVALPIDDCEPIAKEILDLAWKAYQQAKGPVLIHCAEGVSRSVSVAYAILRREGIDHKTAEAVTRIERRPAHPVTLASARQWAESFDSDD